MCDLEALARQAFQKITRNRLARCVANGMHKAVKPGPMRLQVIEHLRDLLVATYVAVKNQLGIKVSGKFGDALFKPFTHVTECQLCSLCAAGFGDAVGDRAVRENSGDQEFFASEKAHECSSV